MPPIFTQNINQFAQKQIPGALDLQSNPKPNVLNCRYNPKSSDTTGIPPGTPLKLVDLSTDDVDGLPVVDVATAETDIIIGMSTSNSKDGLILPGKVVEVAMQGAVMWLVAKTTMNRGQTVAADKDNFGQVITTTGLTGYVLGFLIDKAIVAGQLYRVMIIANGTKFSGQVSS